MRYYLLILGCFIFLLTLGGGCGKETPSRDHIPVLRHQLYKLQEAVKAKDRVLLDSLLSVKILSNKQNSDSLLSFVFNYNDSYFPFERFGDYVISYTEDKARIDCYVMDSTNTLERPIVLTLVYEHDLWLLKRFEPGHPVMDDKPDSL